MRLPIILAVVTLSLLTGGTGGASETSAGLHTFYGEIVALNPATKLITIKNGNQRFAFHYTDETKVGSRFGHVRLDRIKRGSAAAIVMRVGEGNTGVAVGIRIDPDASLLKNLSQYSAKTVRGKTIRGLAVNNFVEYQPPADAWAGGARLESGRVGRFVLSVAPDGTVSHVTFLQSLGYPELDARAANWLRKWRFHPNSVTEVQLPMQFSQSRYSR